MRRVLSSLPAYIHMSLPECVNRRPPPGKDSTQSTGTASGPSVCSTPAPAGGGLPPRA